MPELPSPGPVDGGSNCAGRAAELGLARQPRNTTTGFNGARRVPPANGIPRLTCNCTRLTCSHGPPAQGAAQPRLQRRQGNHHNTAWLKRGNNAAGRPGRTTATKKHPIGIGQLASKLRASPAHAAGCTAALGIGLDQGTAPLRRSTAANSPVAKPQALNPRRRCQHQGPKAPQLGRSSSANS